MNYHCPRPPKQRAFDTSLLMWRRRFLGGSFSPASLFASGEDGGWYDPSDLTTLFQERTGASATTPSGVGAVVGTILDKSGNGNHLVAPSDAARPVLRDEIVAGTSVDVSGQTNFVDDPTFDTSFAASNWTDNSSGTGTASIASGVATLVGVDNSNRGRIDQIVTGLTANKWYLLEFDTTVSAQTLFAQTNVVGVEGFVIGNFTTGSHKRLFRTTTNDITLTFIAGINGSSTITIDNISVREVPASAARRYYLQGDNTDDKLLGTCNIDFSSGTLAQATRSPTSDLSSFFSHRSTSTSNRFGLTVPFGTTGHIADCGGVSARILDTNGETTFNNIPLVSLLTQNGTVTNGCAFRQNGAQFGVRTGVSPGGNMDRIGIGTEIGGAGLVPSRFYCGVAVNRVLTTAERENLEIYLANKSGATLV